MFLQTFFMGQKLIIPTTGAADQVAKWKKLGNSLLLRLGMRYSKLNPTKAASIVSEAFAGGVMTSNTIMHLWFMMALCLQIAATTI